MERAADFKSGRSCDRFTLTLRPSTMQNSPQPNEPPIHFWPAPLAHCGRPLVGDYDDEIIVGEYSSERIDNFAGNRMLFTALVPEQKVDSILTAVGGMGHHVRMDTHSLEFDSDGGCHPQFWLYGPDGSTRFESLVREWESHNRVVLLPSDALLACYRLVPQILKDGSISWDDLKRPAYGVVRVTPRSDYATDTGFTTARVTIQRDYLEDYLSLKGCVAIASYYDERFSFDDPTVAPLLGQRGSYFKQSGRELWFLPMQLDDANQVSQVWGCALLLRSKGSPISNPEEMELKWPDRESPIKGSGRGASFQPFEYAFVRDEVLVIYEKRPEFWVSAESGALGYDSRWSVGYCKRFGRNHIRLELRKLYEGAPDDVVKHYNTFAVKSEVAEQDVRKYGEPNVGMRSKNLVYAFLRLTETLSSLGNRAGLPLTQADIGRYNTEEVEYRGWGSFPELRTLGNVVPLSLSFTEFLSRCKDTFKLIENLREGSIRQILIRLGIDKEKIETLRSLRLLATLCQLASIAAQNGFGLVSDCAQISARWDGALIFEDFKPLFALCDLRIADAHPARAKVSGALDVFGIDERNHKSGWGTALDTVYDRTLTSLTGIEALIRESNK